MNKFIRFTIFNNEEQKDVIVDCLIDLDNKSFSIFKDINGNFEDDLKVLIDNTYEITRCFETVKFSKYNLDFIERLKNYIFIQNRVYGINCIGEIKELYNNLTFKFTTKRFDSIGFDFDVYQKIYQFFSLFNNEFNNYEKETISTINIKDDFIEFKLFTNENSFYLKDEIKKFIDDIENETEDIEFAKKNQIYFNLYKYLYELFELDFIEDFSIELDEIKSQIKNRLYIGYIYDDIYNEIYNRVEIKIKGKDNKANPNNMNLESVKDIFKTINEITKTPKYKNSNNLLYSKAQVKSASFSITIDIRKDDKVLQETKINNLVNNKFNNHNISLANSLAEVISNNELESISIIENNQEKFKLTQNDKNTFIESVETHKNKLNQDNREKYIYLLFYATNNKTHKFTAYPISEENEFTKSFSICFSNELEEEQVNRFTNIIKTKNHTDISETMENIDKFKALNLSIKQDICKARVVKIKNRYEILYLE